MKKLRWFLATILLLSTFSTPVQLRADGTPPPVCPNGQLATFIRSISTIGLRPTTTVASSWTTIYEKPCEKGYYYYGHHNP